MKNPGAPECPPVLFVPVRRRFTRGSGITDAAGFRIVFQAPPPASQIFFQEKLSQLRILILTDEFSLIPELSVKLRRLESERRERHDAVSFSPVRILHGADEPASEAAPSAFLIHDQIRDVHLVLLSPAR